MHSVWSYKGDVYLIGCTNVGKSTLFNAFLRSDYCKVKASNIIRKATASLWPGTTMRLLKFPILRPSDWRVFVRNKRIMSERAKRYEEAKLRKDQAVKTGKVEYATLIGHIGRTFQEPVEDEVRDSFSMGQQKDELILTIDEKSKDYVKSHWCYDTPGVVQPDQVLNLLTTEELLLTIPKQMILPRTYLLKPNMTLFLAGLGRCDYISGCESIRVTVYASSQLPILIVNTNHAEQVYNELLGCELLAVPRGDAARLEKWPKMKSSNVINICGKGNDISACDLLLSSAGWIAVNYPLEHTGQFQIWTPTGRGLFVRDPSLIQFGGKLRGKRIRGSLAYSSKKAFIKQ